MNNIAPGNIFSTEISQLDYLLKEGGIKIPNNKDGVSILIKGLAGAGKSTLALLLAAKCAKDGGPCLYCALEQNEDSIIRLANSMIDDEEMEGIQWVKEDDDVPDKDNLKGFVCISRLYSSKNRERDFKDYLYLLETQTNTFVNSYESEKTSMIVIDSLNVFGPTAITRSEFEKLKESLAAANRILVFVGEPDNQNPGWDRLVDMVIELGNESTVGDYFLRTISVSKARFQNHILGSHIVKIKGRGADILAGTSVEASAAGKKSDIGLFIYPSLHYHLSVAINRRQMAEINGLPEKGKLRTGFDALDHALDGGIKRGTMVVVSSNLPYIGKGIGLSFLANGAENQEKSLYLSLHDDEDSILNLPSDKNVKEMAGEGSFVIKSFRPGFISAEEFVDKIINVILDSTKQNAIFQRVVFDDVSQIGLRFPLLENAPVFLPTLMDIFRLYDITAMFLSTSVSSVGTQIPPRNNLYDLVNTVIEIQKTDQLSETKASVRIRKIAEQYYLPKELALVIEHQASGRISIVEQSS